MRDGDIDYSTYTLTELHEARAGIDANAWPRNAAHLLAELATRAPEPPPPEDDPADWPVFDEPPPRPPGPYVQNQVPLQGRLTTVCWSLALIAYGTYGLWRDDLYIPARHGDGMHLHHRAAWLMAGAILAGVVCMASTIVDHYDRRDNESSYRQFERWVGAVVLILALVAMFSPGAGDVPA